MLAQERILGDELGLAAWEVSQGVYDKVRPDQFGGRVPAPTESLHEAVAELAGVGDKSSEYQGRSLTLCTVCARTARTRRTALFQCSRAILLAVKRRRRRDVG